MDKSSKPLSSSQHPATSPSWLTVLAVLTFIHTSAFITVTVLQFSDLMTIDEEENNLRQTILHLAAEVNSGSNDREKITPRDTDEEVSSQKNSIHSNQVGNHKRATSIFSDILMAQGEHGDKGLLGEKGAVGELGDPGLQGVKGDTGDIGSTGHKGATGEQGKKGLDVKPIIGDCDCLKKPAFDVPSASDYVVSPLSQSAEFPCNATGFPTPFVTITKTASSGKHGVQNVPGYIFIQSEADYGTYTCTAENVFGKALKQVTIVKTGEKPAILRIPFDNVYQLRTNVTYVCDAFGMPPPEVRFLKDGQEVNSTSRLRLIKATRLNGTSVTLLFQNLDASDIGTYACTAINALGEITSQPFQLNATTNIHG
ncbi:hypothetical protein ACJMK2_025528 [Sinanodonta woodiana]|uniref:Ig-like domain-containing protein n=1 Tax=Sinanodonta woodiana TaxID=1069815 RepID=A0ABD3XKA3_SINWO